MGLRKKVLSINAAYEVTRLTAEKQSEISERIEKGENPQKVVAEVKAVQICRIFYVVKP